MVREVQDVAGIQCERATEQTEGIGEFPAAASAREKQLGRVVVAGKASDLLAVVAFVELCAAGPSDTAFLGAGRHLSVAPHGCGLTELAFGSKPSEEIAFEPAHEAYHQRLVLGEGVPSAFLCGCQAFLRVLKHSFEINCASRLPLLLRILTEQIE